ncbi:hypothetical protein EMPS_01306 [Entomortierella parvispora]|uniref:DNA2/NAM7 helicase-like C-terminal domain-containing protein n=1 Tax=Entomortierella parvispora TaxID=205924 RepID=A0A9P3H2R0_9FUNG|nr:hypothetical protein EMPS_01306 [Entomortierella parvispora]
MSRQKVSVNLTHLPPADPAFLDLLRRNGLLPARTPETPRVLPPSPKEQDLVARQSFEHAFSSLTLTEEQWAYLDEEVPLSPPAALPPPVDTGAPTLQAALSSRLDVTKETGPRVFKFSPSVLAHHANTACEKMLHLKGKQLYLESLAPKSDDGASADPAVIEPESISEATMARGIVFEAQLQASIPNQVDCKKEGDTDSLFRLSTEPEGTTLCQAIFSLGPEFYTPAMKEAGIIFGHFLPDFIQILPGSPLPDGTRKKRIFIIDAKSSSHVKISHQFQVTLYAIFLEHLLRVNHQDHLVEIDPQGGVWLPGHEEPKTFSLVFMQPLVENFLFHELPEILSKPLKEAIWHIDYPCLQCEFLPQCKEDAREQMTLSLIPLLSKKSAMWIKALFKSPSTNSSEICDLEDLVRDHDHLTDVRKSAFRKVMKVDNHGKSLMVAAYREQNVKVIASQTMDLPRLFQDRLLINLAIDPMTLLPYAYSLDLFKDNQLDANKSASDVIDYSPHDSDDRMSDHNRLTTEFIDTLHEWLVLVSDLPRPPILSVFTYAQSTLDDLYHLLLKVIAAVSDVWTPVTKDRALSILVNLYHDPSFLTLTGSAGANVQLPDFLGLTQGYKNVNPVFDKRLFCIENAIQSMLVIPVIGKPTFKDVMAYLVDVESPLIIDDRNRDDEGFQLTEIYKAWRFGSQTRESFKRGFKNWAQQQSLILVSLYAILRRENGDLGSFLVAPQAPFKLRLPLKIHRTVLAQFAFFLQWEAIMRAEKLRTMRVFSTNEESFQRQSAFEMRFIERHVGPLPGSSPNSRVSTTPLTSRTSAYYAKFEITSRLNAGVFDNQDFPSWIISASTAEGEKSRMRFDDINAMLRPYGRGTPSIVSVPYFDVENKIAYVKGTYENMTEVLRLQPGDMYILEKREYNPTLVNSMNKLVEMNDNCRLFLKLMADPNKWGLKNPTGFEDVFIESMSSPARTYDFTLSQDQAFSQVIRNRLQIIWGPPGSGKTHFLALTVLRMVDILNSLAKKGKGQGVQTIVLTAFTHAAINNLAARVAKLHQEIAPRPGSEDVVGPLKIYRLGSATTPKMDELPLIDPKDLGRLSISSSDNVVRIICGTVWQIRKVSHPTTGVSYMQNVQMLMIDEGSQLLSADAVHAIECLDPHRGRLIVAGDHLQLGPVISGDYPKPEQGVDPTGSIMRNLMRKKDNTPISLHWVEGAPMDETPCTWQLKDNFRMNMQLGTFMQNIYGAGYKIINPGKSLPYSGTFLGASLTKEIRYILDPERSAIAVELQIERGASGPNLTKLKTDSRAAAFLEAVFVSDIVEGYLKMVGTLTTSSVFVAVPHHIQRQAILNQMNVAALMEEYPLINLKVDTIEKMQGQEADLVVVCFAFFDESMLVGELEYMYSVHRWVVALSRARCKTVLMMTPELRAPKLLGGTSKAKASSLESLDGWGLLQAFEKYAVGLGGKLELPINEDVLCEAGMDAF